MSYERLWVKRGMGYKGFDCRAYQRRSDQSFYDSRSRVPRAVCEQSALNCGRHGRLDAFLIATEQSGVRFGVRTLRDALLAVRPRTSHCRETHGAVALLLMW